MAGWLTGREWTTFPGCGLTRSDRDFYGATAAANPVTAQLETAFTLLGKTGDVSTNLGGTGAGNQRFPDAGRLVTAADRYLCDEAYNGFEVEPHARGLGSYTTTTKDGVAASRLTNGVSTGVAADPTLENVEPLVTWNAALLHVGLEGLNPNRGQLSPQAALGLLHDFVSDSVSVAVTHKVTAGRVAFVAQASSARGAAITTYRWDFGDGSPIVETTVPSVSHDYGKGSRGTYDRQRRGRERTHALRPGVGDRSSTRQHVSSPRTVMPAWPTSPPLPASAAPPSTATTRTARRCSPRSRQRRSASSPAVSPTPASKRSAWRRRSDGSSAPCSPSAIATPCSCASVCGLMPTPRSVPSPSRSGASSNAASTEDMLRADIPVDVQLALFGGVLQAGVRLASERRLGHEDAAAAMTRSYLEGARRR